MTLKSALEVTQGHSNWCHSYSPSIVTMAIFLTVYEIFSIKVWHELEN